VGAIHQKLLSTMIILAVYYTLTGSIIILQVYYYRRRSRQTDNEIVGEIIPLVNNPPTPESRRQERIKQFLSILISFVGVCLTGVIAYVISSRMKSQEISDNEDQGMNMVAQIFGWTSAFLYLGARIPQIIQNYQNKSTEGLSLAMFCFCVLGNISYSLSIILYSTDQEYLLKNLAWLVGSGGTLFLDLIIFVQFYIYSNW